LLKEKVTVHHKKFGLLLSILAVSAIILSALPGRPAEADSPISAKYVVLISIDACREDYLAIAPTPNIDKLKMDGTYYANSWVGAVVNDTPPAQAAMSTGRFPKNMGIYTFLWRDDRFFPNDFFSQLGLVRPLMGIVKATGWTDLGLWIQNAAMGSVLNRKASDLAPTSWSNVTSGFFTGLIRETGATSMQTQYKKVNPGSTSVAISSVKYYAAAGLAGDRADSVIFADAKKPSEDKGYTGYTEVEQLKPAGIKGMMPPEYIMNDTSLVKPKVNPIDIDVWATDVALRVIERDKPTFMLINLPATDNVGHASGAAKDKMAPIVANADQQIGRIMDIYKKLGIYDQTVFVITSDHGMTPTTVKILPLSLRRTILSAGNMALPGVPHITLAYPDESQQTAEKISNASLPGLNRVYYKVQLPDRSWTYKPTAATVANIPDKAEKAYEYLLSTVATEHGFDIHLEPDEDAHIRTLLEGQHETASWLQQHNFLVISGPGVNKGAVTQSPARLVDIAPTVLTLMGVEAQGMDGIVLADALQSPTQQQQQQQSQVNSELMPMTQGLKELSQSDLSKLKAK
jgi:predicted AlkP superfamily pyrophosphatase or phosphodiesterase